MQHICWNVKVHSLVHEALTEASVYASLQVWVICVQKSVKKDSINSGIRTVKMKGYEQGRALAQALLRELNGPK